MAFKTLISPEKLAPHINDLSWRVFDCRHELSNPDAGRQAYDKAHIRNAQFLHLERDLSAPKTGSNGRHPLPDAAALAAKLAQCGVSNETQVVAYDDTAGMYAARLWWLLRWLGHERVAVLDGGLAAWQRAGHPVTDIVPTPKPAVFDWHASVKPVDTAYVLAHLQDPQVLLVDARGADRFRGENETIDPVAGHIPGAINRPFRDNVIADGRFKPGSRLHEEFIQVLGPHPAENVVAYCGSGVSACHNLLALEVAGMPGARLYPGSWSEWCSDRARPIATGVDSRK